MRCWKPTKEPMTIYIAALLTFLIAFFALSVGMIFSDIKIKGHCGSQSLDGDCCDAGVAERSNPGFHVGNCFIDESGNKVNCDTCDCDD